MRIVPLLVLMASVAGSAGAEVVRVEITRRTDLLRGRSFGPAGPYEALEGRILFSLDPGNRANARIVDLGLAPRTAQGRVEFWADFAVLRPKRANPNGVALFEVSNRGLKYLHAVLDFGSMSPRIETEADLGDGMLLRMGLTIVWVGWQHDVPEGPDRLGLEAPVARAADGSTLTGLLRSDWVIPRPTATLPLGHGGAEPYPAIDREGPETVLTVRDGRNAAGRVVPRSEWRFAREGNGAAVDDPRFIYRAAGFDPGRIYELVYKSQDPKVAGVGLAAIRDAMSYAKYDSAAVFPARHAIGFGISQTGRLLRHYLYQGFNTDERNRAAFDGLLIHVAGAGRGSFNHRFAQPSRDGHRFDAFFFPTDLFPFATTEQTDPVTGQTDGLLAHPLDARHWPKVVQSNSGYEYWGRAASLIHTTVDGTRDLAPPANERIYHLAGGQHVPAAFPPAESTRHPASRAYRSGPLDYRLPLRALLVGLVEWVRDGRAPLPSAYPRIEAGGLVPIDRVAWRLPNDLAAPRVVHAPERLDFGPRWAEGIVEREPPELGPVFPVGVPQVDSLGNEIGGIRSVELEVPLASHFTWNTRVGAPGDQGELTRILGTFLPLPRAEDERRATADPRPTVGSLYRSRAQYEARVRAAVKSLLARRMLVADDSSRAVARAMQTWDWMAGPR
ncbi:MAG: alpha/beta hydrolase domain-containing protein [Gemmatimonadales bacterium]